MNPERSDVVFNHQPDEFYSGGAIVGDSGPIIPERIVQPITSRERPLIVWLSSQIREKILTHGDFDSKRITEEKIKAN